MSRPDRAPRRAGPLLDATDAALQLTLPLFGRPAPARAKEPGRHVVRLGEQLVGYSVRRTRRRTIGFVIDDRGLSITSPHWVPLHEIERALHDKSAWVLRKLVEWREYAERRERLRVRWEDGAALPFLGETLLIRVDAVHAPPARRTRTVPVTRDGDALRVALPVLAGVEELRRSVQHWLQGRAVELFAERIDTYAERLGERPSRWSLSSARTRWGSCGPDGAIRLNWRLVHFPRDIVDYVIAHELAHLRELNHGARFWATVEQLYPEFRAARAWLRSYPDDVSIS